MEERPFPAWSWSVEQCLKEYSVKLEKGLSSFEVEKRRQKYGWNELQKEKGKPLWQLVLEQFDDVLVKILLVAAFISFVLAYFQGHESGEKGFEAYVEPFVIVMILVLNSIVGVWQETNAEKALEALKEMQSETAKVLRDGHYVPHLPARELVPGDIVELRVGDKAPADMRVAALKTLTLRVEQSSLTGEAMPVLKSINPVLMDDCELQAKECMVFAGTTVVNGSCLCIVASTGMCTEIGKIQTQIHKASLENDDTPLKKKLDEFGGRLTTAIGIVCLVVWVINYRNFLTWELVDGWPTNLRFSFEKCTYYFKIAVALAVAAIPEGLPAVITTCLALGTRKMAQKNAIVRKLPSVETLGCTTVICSDKTGTLTTNQMSVHEFFTLGGKTTSSRIFRVEGTTYDPKNGSIVDWDCYNWDANLQAMAEICAICNDAGIFCSGRLFRATGLPTEAALKVLVEKMGVPDTKARNRIRSTQLAADYLIDSDTVKLGCCEWWEKRSKRIATLEFDRIRKSMSVIVREPTGSNRLLVKGAVEGVLERSSNVQLADGSIVPMDEQCRQLLLLRNLEMSSKGLRCLGLAYRDDLGEFSDYYEESHPAHKKLLDPANYSSIESNLVFVGVVGLRDPPRDEVHKSIEDCKEAGIKVMVITGDNKSTAEAICREIRLFSGSQDLRQRSFTGKEFMALSSTEQIQILTRPGGMVFSRAEPKHKQEIVRMLKEMGEVVAMTGDGVNDAPALKLADIGIAMGITGTEVAKEASDMVLADDNFSTIVSAVAEGRSIYNNMKAFIRYMISSNVGEVISIFLTAALGIPECLIPVQLLWVNLVTDGPPATALGFNPADIDIMQKPPRKSNDALINSWVFFRYMVIGSYVGIATVGIFVLWYTQPSFMGINLAMDGHTLVSLSQLRTWGECPTWSNFTAAPFKVGGGRVITFSNPCEYFSVGKVKAMTLSLSVLVAIEMFNSLNALSEDNSLVRMPPWRNIWLLVAMSVSFGLHFLILYVPLLANVFGIVPLSLNEWVLVIMLSFPVVLIDEALKFFGRSQRRRTGKDKKE
ncbi:calcium-transporting ATPase, endoplasmic reticulum-type [Macadamia integrifolia]|uniref:calcium-transporting ATPase, endoplasmic reticulum-type n=1 Tax=Macadamia integrifolia TaxID=60698 RepID=UPI001C52B1ED|nr:calcium-transporting ATPase, endoplasmic reticulum-type [Macadamia integrifolia]XP_042479490.1 calcium-transporting ATPase, endoplasmic reticulum-type [Macadamia integrifolia]XP_042479491.1 calcium-transporting ATPase, endoplasmic reticulum-type [Macadamia integrifolia]XP_042479492.1 calcium-transporting ATPase, endoplasmic reticulum-type [Macadamia integrifolia]XP_042479493.1 calcium-transporting ATPase, endoplasmic reticulum-type [Macadamia integrifolia]XP_042479494.1 calcium-transporting